MFPSRVTPGKPIGHLSHVFRKMAKAARLSDFRLHDCRHHFASTLATSGASLHLVGQLLGHSSPSVTAKYSHLADSAQQAGVDHVGRALDAVFAGKAGEVVSLKRRDSANR